MYLHLKTVLAYLFMLILKNSHKKLSNTWVQALYSTPDQSKSGSACHMTRSSNHRLHSVVI